MTCTGYVAGCQVHPHTASRQDVGFSLIRCPIWMPQLGGKGNDGPRSKNDRSRSTSSCRTYLSSVRTASTRRGRCYRSSPSEKSVTSVLPVGVVGPDGPWATTPQSKALL